MTFLPLLHLLWHFFFRPVSLTVWQQSNAKLVECSVHQLLAADYRAVFIFLNIFPWKKAHQPISQKYWIIPTCFIITGVEPLTFLYTDNLLIHNSNIHVHLCWGSQLRRRGHRATSVFVFARILKVISCLFKNHNVTLPRLWRNGVWHRHADRKQTCWVDDVRSGGSPWITPSLAPSRVFLPCSFRERLTLPPEETQSFQSILSQLRCDPATGFSPITTPLQHSTALSTLPHTWTAVNPNSGRCLRNIELGPHLPRPTDKGNV